MKQAQIRLHIELDEENLPDKIFWEASDAPNNGAKEAKAINLSIWDGEQRETMRIDLWAKDMLSDEMKYFVVDTMAGMADTIQTATGDEEMANQIHELCEKLFIYIRKQHGQ
ncbi:MAG: gliding motility protein GldC [Thermoflexibacter sp.]|jgi:gliding motility-associated protein GldC|nr:gliding motility protein GldC [Thermoflexibacter sp.]